MTFNPVLWKFLLLLVFGTAFCSGYYLTAPPFVRNIPHYCCRKTRSQYHYRTTALLDGDISRHKNGIKQFMSKKPVDESDESGEYDSNISEQGETMGKETSDTTPGLKSTLSSNTPVAPARKQLDPLVRSLTRIDAETAEAPSLKIPIVGEIVLDKSLFVLVPVASFAVLGALLALYVALNAGDAYVQLEEAATVGQKAPSLINESAGCRGLCSSQEQDLEGLREFMTNFGKSK